MSGAPVVTITGDPRGQIEVDATLPQLLEAVSDLVAKSPAAYLARAHAQQLRRLADAIDVALDDAETSRRIAELVTEKD